MKCHADIKALALEKFKDSECLLANGRFDAAYYFAGYTAELLIKSKVCKTLGIEDFFDFGNRKKFKNDDSIVRPFRVHDLEQLMVLSGIFKQFDDQLKVDGNLKGAWSIIIKWNENSRYLTGRTEKDVKDLLTSISIFQRWILKYL